ncbi:MAG: hypothetical protein RLZZ618_41 [Pseudomonadota bacterium]|jgi:peptidyl-prolyl cis-trans isomerase SurA
MFSRLVLLLLPLALVALPVQAQTRAPVPRTADYILAVVNQELVTSNELRLRLDQVREESRRTGARLPLEDELRAQLLNALIEERVLVTYARDTGSKIDDAELDRAVASVAAQNQLSLPQLRDRLRSEGVEYTRFRSNIRDQMMVERVREREVQGRIRVTDADVDAYLEKKRAESASAVYYNLAHILVAVPEGSTDAVVAARRARAEAALARVTAGTSFDVVAREVSDDATKEYGGLLGMRAADRLPPPFLDAVRNLAAGQVVPTVLRSGAGFHVLKLAERREGGPATATQTHARHILLRTTPQLTQQAAVRRLGEFKRSIVAGTKSFEQIARESSEDGSAPQGGDLGWVGPGVFVPEFEEVMNTLPLRGISEPAVSRFGVHLIQVLERREVALEPKQLRDKARAALREQKYEEANAEWMRELRTRAYIEMREPPQ